MTKRFNSVEDMIDSIYEDKPQAKETKAFLRSKQLSRILTLLRTHANLSQEDMAKKLGWSQSKISKLEHLSNDDFNMGDLEAYTDAMGFNIEISFPRKHATLVDKVKYSFFQMKGYLDKLTGLAGNDAKIQNGVNKFMSEAGFNLMLEAASCLEKGKPKRREAGISIRPPMLESESEREAAELLTA